MIATGTFCCTMFEGFFRCYKNRENFYRDRSVNPLPLLGDHEAYLSAHPVGILPV